MEGKKKKQLDFLKSDNCLLAIWGITSPEIIHRNLRLILSIITCCFYSWEGEILLVTEYEM